MSKDKSDYDKGYDEGRHDSGRIKTTNEIINDAIIPGTLPSEKGSDYKSGYDQGKSDGKR